MAKRRINFAEVDYISNTDSFAKALGEKADLAKKLVATKRDGSMIVIEKNDFDKKVGDVIDVIPIMTDIEKGVSLMEQYLLKEISLMKKFFDDFGITPVVDYDEGWIQVKNFPLPDYVMVNGEKYIYPNDYEDMLFVLDNFPEFPPIGFHIHKKSPNVKIFESIFQTHFYDSIKIGGEDYIENVSELSGRGWKWICFHFKDNKWDYRRNDIPSGDTLTYYFAFIYAVMNGLELSK